MNDLGLIAAEADGMSAERPRLIEGGLAVDDRGSVMFVNDFDLDEIRRFYVISNHAVGFVRAWHYHRHERKYVVALKGAVLVQAVAVDNEEHPSRDLEVHRFVLSDVSPSALVIPPRYAHGTMTLSAGAKVIFFSDSTLKESLSDDIRYAADYWGSWNVTRR
jgi:dTDP-4-dehydrorhamnose 3,5-epimerase